MCDSCPRCGNKLVEVDNTMEAIRFGMEDKIILYCNNCEFRKVKGE